MSHGIGVAALFAQGPRADLEVFYGRFTVGGGGTTFTASADTNTGLVVAGAAGVYTLTHPKMKFALFIIEAKVPVLATVSAKRECNKKAVDDPTTGILNFNTTDEAAPPVVNAPVDGTVIEVLGLGGF